MFSWFIKFAIRWRLIGGHAADHRLMGLRGVDAEDNVALGASNPLPSLNTGADNTAVGVGALDNITSGSGNWAFGHLAGTDAVVNITTQSNRGVLGNNDTTNIYAKVSLTVTSDERDKTDFKALGWTAEMFQLIKVGEFQFKNRNTGVAAAGLRYGFSAQNLHQIETSNLRKSVLVDASERDHLKLNEAMMVPLLVGMVQELQRRVSELERRTTGGG